MTAASAAVRRGDEPPMSDDETDNGPVGAAQCRARAGDGGGGGGGAAPPAGCPSRRCDRGAGWPCRGPARLPRPRPTLLGVDRDPAARCAMAAERLAAFGRPRAACARERSPTCRRCWPTKRLGRRRRRSAGSRRELAAARRSRRAASASAHDGPLDMRMDPDAELSAEDIVNTWDEGALARAIARLGEEPRARAVARAIVRARPLATTSDLADVVARAVGRGKPGLHPATRTFQAIRIARERRARRPGARSWQTAGRCSGRAAASPSSRTTRSRTGA